jgi:hypothetical protein
MTPRAIKGTTLNVLLATLTIVLFGTLAISPDVIEDFVGQEETEIVESQRAKVLKFTPKATATCPTCSRVVLKEEIMECLLCGDRSCGTTLDCKPRCGCDENAEGLDPEIEAYL